MQHNNNNNAIANELNSIIISLADINVDNIKESLEIVESKISHLEDLSQKMEIPELRALTHWMMLNTELDDKNETKISELLENGSYYNWMEVLSVLLSAYDQTLLPIIYRTLTEPKWLVKPSAPLLRNLASWIETARIATTKNTDLLDEQLIIADTINTNSNQSPTIELTNDLETTDKFIFEDVESTILGGNYDGTSAEMHFSESSKDDTAQVTTENTNNYYDQIEEEIIIDPTEEIFSPNHDTNITDEVKEDNVAPNVVAEVTMDNIDLKDTSFETILEETSIVDEETDDFSIEVDDIIMSLATISANAKNVLDPTEEYTAELQRFEMLADISGYSQLSSMSKWCKQNLNLFAEQQSDALRQFVEMGECWIWMELIKLAIENPDEISTISELNTELSRDEWLKPLVTEDLQALLLFLRNPSRNIEDIETAITTADDDAKTEDKNSNETAVESTDKIEESEYTFKWDEDVHPELLEVYFEETNDNIIDISAYLKNIEGNIATKEQRQDARRTAHTIKGGSAVVGITALSTYAYQLEKILDYAIEHTLPSDAHNLLHTAATCVESLYNAIKEKKSVPSDFSVTLSKLTNYAEALEELDDAPLELSAPVLPDFITQQNTAKNSSIEENVVIEDESKIEAEIIEDVIELKEIEPEAVEEEIESNIKETIEESLENQTEEKTKTVDEITVEIIDENINETDTEESKDSSQPTLNQNDDLSDFTAELDDIVMTLITTEVQAEKKPFKLDAYIEELQRLDMLAEISGYPEIAKISDWYQDNLGRIAKKGTKKLGEFVSSGESWAWIELVSACLADPEDISHLSALSTELTRTEWVKPLDIEELQALLLVLRNSNSAIDNALDSTVDTSSNNSTEEYEDTVDETESKNIENKVVDKSTAVKTNIITWDDDVHPELLAVYLQETSEQVEKIAELLHLISKGKANKEQQEHAARIAHTIKGASGVVGINEIVNFTHKLEDILDYAVNNKIPAETAELLAESSDCLESLFEAVQDKAEVPEEFEPVLAKLTTYAEIIESDFVAIDDSPVELDMPELPDFITKPDTSSTTENDNSDNTDKTEVENTTEEKNEDTTQETIQEIATTSSNSATKQTSSLKSNDAPVNESYIRVPTTLINKLLNLAGELVTTSSQVSDKVEITLVTSTQIKEQDKRVHNMLDELSSTIYKQEKDQMTMLSSMQNKDFDTLEMDTYNELHSVAGLLTESILDSEAIEGTLKYQLSEIHNDLRLLDNLNKELSETILNSRMESLNTLIPRLERIVRQTCRKTNKNAELIVTGKDINIDTEILNGLVDPLLHLLRNAVDHGIEAPKARKKKNKTGQIQLNFSRQGNFIHMQLKDDGAGIDPEKIYQSAINKGLITPDQEYSKSEVLKLILEPGFTTQTDVTDISGRGVGMDVVNKGIEALKGSLSITSVLGKGTSFDVKIPLTLVTSSTLLVETAGNKVAIPTDSIEQLYYLAPEDVLSRNKDKYIRHEGKELVIESLASILGWPASDVDFTKAQTLLLIKGSQKLHAVYIDEIIHSREVVIKSLAHFIDGTKGVIGACHLSDGEVAPVMNLPQLLSLNEESSYIVKHLDASDITVTTTNHTPQILVVDDSLSNRKALSLIIEKTEYDVITAVDGLDALNVMNEQHIDLVFTDLEMPRMTGLELTQAIRAWDEKKEVPIVMVTSRSTNKHRELAKKAGVDDYLTKPVGTDTLLESIETWLKQTVEV